MRGSFLFYKSFYEESKQLNPQQKAELFEAICEYAFHEEITQPSPPTLVVFKGIKTRLQANFDRFKKIKHGGSYQGSTQIQVEPKILLNL